jgi:hypothetical protein
MSDGYIRRIFSRLGGGIAYSVPDIIRNKDPPLDPRQRQRRIFVGVGVLGVKVRQELFLGGLIEGDDLEAQIGVGGPQRLDRAGRGADLGWRQRA